MYFTFVCDNCTKRLKVRQDYSGKRTRCPYCRASILVPAPPAPENLLNFAEPGKSTTEGERKPDAATEQPKKPAVEASVEEAASGTEVSLWKTGLIGFASFVVIYAVLYPLPAKFYLRELLYERSWVQFAEMFLACWSAAMLVIKFRKLAVQRESMLLDPLPEQISQQITPASAEQFIQHIRGLPIRSGESFLINRVRRGLEHFGILKSTSEVTSRVASQSDIDGNAVDSSYALLKVFIWAIPILGFIGTVMGIGAAVGSFSATMSAANDMSALKDSFNNVTSGLATAFDTTLLALALSMMIMFPMSWLQKAEQDLLNWVDEYCNENLFRRLRAESGGDLSPGIDQKALQAAIDAAMVGHHAELQTWNKKLEAIGETLTQQVAKGWAAADKQMQARHGQLSKELTSSVQAFQELAGELKRLAEEQAVAMAQLSQKTSETQNSLATAMEQSAGTVADIGQRTADTQKTVATAMQQSADAIRASANSFQGYFTAVEKGVNSLNRALVQLGEKQVLLQVPAPARRSGWWPFGSRNSGKGR
jgi:biopolymer transport protein ExbB/TolQ/DNA-directed RNA polymerase subunit RPC12/RpoP